jgi:hypothetical protein
MDRREFTSASIMALLSGVTITIAGCSETDSPTTPGPSPSGNVSATSITDNHGHTGTVTGAEIMAGNQISVNIRGGSDHPHTVVLEMGDLVTLGNGQSVTKESSSDGSPTYGQHSHTVTFG